MKYEVANEYPGDEWVAYIEVCLQHHYDGAGKRRTKVFCYQKLSFVS